MNKKIKVIITIIIILICIMAFNVYLAFQKTNEIAQAIQIQNIDLKTIDDGVYTGACNADLVNVKVEVEIKNHKFVKINIVEHQNGKGKAAEQIVERVIQSNTLDVDVVSGASVSSNVILKAIENAIT